MYEAMCSNMLKVRDWNNCLYLSAENVCVLTTKQTLQENFNTNLDNFQQLL